MGYEKGKRLDDWRCACMRAIRLLCCVATVAVLTVFAVRLGQGIGRVDRGEITPAEMLEDMGDWLRGKQIKTEGND